MSANPQAFDFLRKAAYSFVAANGKDSQKLRNHCAASLAEWMRGEGAGSGLTEAEASTLISDVHHWTMTKYNTPRRRAARNRQQRAAEELAVTFLYEEAGAIYGTPSIRKAALLGGKSKTTIARHLRQQGIAPRRQKKIAALPSMERRLVDILDETFPIDGAGLILIDQLAAALWENRVQTAAQKLPNIAKSTKSTRRKKLRHYLAAIKSHRLGFHTVVIGDVAAIRRGRKFRGFKDTAVWVEEERRLRGIRAIRLPMETSRPLFWNSWLSDLLDVLHIGIFPHFSSPAELEPLLRLARPMLDPRPLHAWFQRAINGRDDFATNLIVMADRIIAPDVRAAIREVASIVSGLSAWAQYGCPFDYFNDAELIIGFMKRFRTLDPDTYARFSYVRERILGEMEGGSVEAIEAAIQHCKQLQKLERSGEWQGPTAQELAYYHPDNEPPF